MIVPSLVAAQGVGGVTGTITNGETGERLDYANVVLTRTSDGAIWGAMSLGGGQFFLNGIPAGSYTLKVLYLGFKPVEQAVTVSAGQTARFTFDLEVTVVKEFDVIAVEGAAIMVNTKETKTTQRIGSEDLTDFAVDSVEEAVGRQAGVVSRGGELFIRGGRSSEVSFRVGGVAVDNPTGTGNVSVSTFSVQSVETVTGGQDAEYGNALSGVVDITTREGRRDKFEFNARYFTDDFGRQDRTYTNYDRFEFGLGGPTGLPRLTWWFAGNVLFTDNENTNHAYRPETKVELFGLELFKYRRRQQNDLQGSLKMAYAFDEQSNMKLTAEFIGNYSRRELFAPNWDVQGFTRQLVRLPVVEQNSNGGFDFSGVYRTFFYGPWVDQISDISTTAPITIESNNGISVEPMPVLRLRDIRGTEHTAIAKPAFVGARNPDGLFSTVQEDSSYVELNQANFGPQFESTSGQFQVGWTHTLSETTFYTIKLARVQFQNLASTGDFKVPQAFLSGGLDGPGVFGGQTRQYSGASDYYTDEANPVFITDGSDWIRYRDSRNDVYSFNFDLTSQRYEGHWMKTGVRVVYNDLQNETLVFPGLTQQDRFTGEYQLGAARNLYHTYNPEASFYLQDRWEYEGMVLNGGFRWDMFSPGSAASVDVENEELDRSVFKYKHALSPRLGFAFPITDRDGFHFHYGRFVQFPSREFLFASQSTVGNSGILGNPNLDAELTVQYQAGINHQFNDFLAATFAVYNRDIYGLIASTQVTDEATGNVLSRYINKAYGNARGVELTLDRRMHNRWSFAVNYTYAFADGVASDQAFGSNPNGLEFLPNQELPLDWDQRHAVAMSLRVAEPNVWATSVTFDYGSGFPWTPFFRFERRQDPLLVNSERFPATYSLNLQAERNVNFYGQRLVLYLQGRNLLNEDVVQGAQANLIPAPILAGVAGNSYLTETGKYGNAYLIDVDGDNINDFVPMNDPRVFGQHRLFRVGLGWFF
jgi:outer membrane receptor protein involved in Fe transport